jgi:hypothetical protein
MTRARTMTRLGRLAMATSSLGTIVLAALVPKCPLCVAAALSAFGVGASAASAVAPAMRPVALALVAVATIMLAFFSLTRMRGHTPVAEAAGTCCARKAATAGLRSGRDDF